jgi:hypothetical protein
MLGKERDGTHTFRKVDMCKWQMGDPETQMKFSDCAWLEKNEYGLVFKALRFK